MPTTYVNPFTGQTVAPSDVGYSALSISQDTTLQWPINGTSSTTVASIIEVMALVSNLNLVLPPATQVSTGQSILIRNTGANTFTVKSSTGATVVAITSGVAQYIYLTDNSTQGGTWATVTFGAGVSQANAATLAGSGLTAIGQTLNQAYAVTSVFSNMTLDNTYRAQFLSWESGAGTLTLPVSGIVGNNWFVVIRNSGTGILTIQTQGTDRIDGNTAQQLQLAESIVICSTGTSFKTFGYGRSSTFPYTILVKTTTGGTTTLTAAEASNVIQEYFGTLTSNATIILPSTVQLYSLSNLTTGSFTLTFKTTAVGGTTIVLPQNQTIIAICDGTNVYNAQTATGSSFNTITLNPATAAAPSIGFTGDLDTGIYQPASGQVGVAVNGSNVATFTATGLAVPTGISGGTF